MRLEVSLERSTCHATSGRGDESTRVLDGISALVTGGISQLGFRTVPLHLAAAPHAGFKFMCDVSGLGVAHSSGSTPVRTLFLAKTRVYGARTSALGGSAARAALG